MMLDLGSLFITIRLVNVGRRIPIGLRADSVAEIGFETRGLERFFEAKIHIHGAYYVGS